MSKATHVSNLTTGGLLRIGGAGKHLQGGQAIPPTRVPNSWYPVNPPIASNALPQNSDCRALLGNLAPLVALLTIQQSVFLGNCIRQVQPGVVAGGIFTVSNAATGAVLGASGATTSWFDQNIAIKEAVAVDVVNKNPALTVDLALRLAAQAAHQIDKQIAAVYGGFTTIAANGAQGATPSPGTLATQINLLPNTGEPVLAAFSTQIAQTASAFQASSVLSSLLLLLAQQVGWGSETGHDGDPPLFNAGANKLVRIMASDAIAVTGTTTQTSHNLIWLPSGLAFASADQGTVLGSAPVISPGGTLSIAASNWFDVEFGTQTQLSLQLVIGNTGTGPQTVYVNCLGAGLVTNVNNGAVVLS